MTDSEAGDIEAQARRCLGNIEAILRAAGPWDETDTVPLDRD